MIFTKKITSVLDPSYNTRIFGIWLNFKFAVNRNDGEKSKEFG